MKSAGNRSWLRFHLFIQALRVEAIEFGKIRIEDDL